MPAPAYFLFSVIPAGLLLWLGTIIGQQQPAEKAARRVFYFLLTTFMLLQAALLTVNPALPGSLWSLAVIPVMTALIPINYLHWRDTQSLHQGRIAAWLLIYLAGLALLAYGFHLTQRDSSQLLLIYGGGTVITLVWRVPLWRGWRRRLSWVAFVGLVITLCVKNFLYNGTTTTWPQETRDLVGLVAAVITPITLVTLVGRLVYEQVAPSGTMRRGNLITYLAMIILLGMLYIANLQETAILDWATDGLGIVLGGLLLAVPAIAVTLLIAWGLNQHRIWVALIYAVGMAVSISIMFAMITRIDPRQVTIQRAEQIDIAIQMYRAANGQYPSDLYNLVPRYLLTIPNPVLFRDQSWCYEGGSEFYRLGYVHRPSFGVPAESITMRIHSSAGEPPSETWECDELLNAYRERFGTHHPSENRM